MTRGIYLGVMAGTIALLGISGSLRTDSYNTKLFKVAEKLLPDHVKLSVSEYVDDLALAYNYDPGQEIPEAVKPFRQEIIRADAILFSTPQYNYNIPKGLKIAIDWAALAEGKNVWAGKPGAVIGAAMDTMGTEKAQFHLRNLMKELQMPVFEGPEINVVSIQDKMDAQGNIKDEALATLLKSFLAEFIKWVGKNI